MFRMNYCFYMAQNPDRDIIYRPMGRMDFLFLLILSPMNFYFEDEIQLARPGACILFTPGTPQHYQSEGIFLNSYLHFYCSDPSILTRWNLPLNRLFYPGNTELLNEAIRKINLEYLGKPPFYEENMDLLLRQFFLSIARDQSAPFSGTQESDLYHRFLDLRMEMLTNCEKNWTLPDLCEAAGFGKSQFSSIYQKFFKTSPKADLLHARIERAKELLSSKTMQVQQAAALSGFQNLYHFSRYFKESCGCTPTQYRDRCNQDPAR